MRLAHVLGDAQIEADRLQRHGVALDRPRRCATELALLPFQAPRRWITVSRQYVVGETELAAGPERVPHHLQEVRLGRHGEYRRFGIDGIEALRLQRQSVAAVEQHRSLLLHPCHHRALDAGYRQLLPPLDAGDPGTEGLGDGSSAAAEAAAEIKQRHAFVERHRLYPFLDMIAAARRM